ncbi:uncharacterized protein LOC117330870 isoform X2 [Pecten maximus]|uniref:uncharacterized protein LOC117330870 isoform X2 n=1 Tax=Pecten maximus TaxID=6579 RepID=UPI0014588132|nr:uncharacterized protein LOC117330870 isoform X2 [Pecten maximus]
MMHLTTIFYHLLVMLSALYCKQEAEIISQMFEIPDDDDNFWEDLPLNDISNENVTLVNNSESELQKNQPCSFDQINFNKKRCVSNHDQPSENQGRQFPNNDVTSGQAGLALERGPDSGCSDSRNNSFQGKLIDSLRGPCLSIPPQPSRVLVPFTQEVVLSRDPLLNSPQTPSANTSTSDTDVRSGYSTSHSNNGRLTNKRKRKFPGPAGLLPRLGQGHTLDSPDISKVKDDVVSPEQGIEKTDLIMSSQSGEEVFNERPWQTLMRDLQDDGQDTLQRFSLASSLQKAKKKQLPKGKVLFVMAVIETLEWPGKDASVTLKDKSGTIQGTIHESLMKEYECDLQPGSVLVLRQVSVISPTSRNHYLNITPANVVCVYCNKSEGLSRLRFVDKDKPLPTILKNLEREMVAELTPQRPRTNTPQSRSNIGTPDIRNLQSRFNTGTPNIGTPQVRLNMGTPDIRTPQSRLNMGTPDIRTPQSRLNMGTPDIRTPQSRLNMGTPDFRNQQPRFSVGHAGKTSVEPSKSYHIGERVPGVGLSGIQGTPVSRTGSSTPHSRPGQSSRNTGANVMEVGVTRPPFGSSTPHTGANFSTPRFSMPDPQQTNNSSIVDSIHMPRNGSISYNSGSITSNTSPSGAAPINRTYQGGSAPGNKTPQGAVIPGCRGVSLNHSTPVADNPYRLQPQNPGHPTAISKSPSDFQKSKFPLLYCQVLIHQNSSTRKRHLQMVWAGCCHPL